jgi:hypothetical protein
MVGDALGAPVAVVVGQFDEPALGVEQAVVDAPGVDADRGDLARIARAGCRRW